MLHSKIVNAVLALADSFDIPVDAYYWKSDKWQYEYKKCHFRTTLRSGIIMHGSKLPFRYWFVAIHLLTLTKKSFSPQEIHRQLGHKRY
ncbi:MAG: hypothetical protein A2W89_21465 [Bacteroidetes bacterium GWE2_42_39]|nr:MAG: hypothetical protein A2W89_21465 [Bacteroidetes bacterium GWE2_42_39]